MVNGNHGTDQIYHLIKIMNIKTEHVIVETQNFYKKIDYLKENKELEIWKNKLKSLIILKKTLALPFAFRDALAELQSVFGGVKSYNPRSEELLGLLNNEILGKIYVKEYFSEESKIIVERIAYNIKEAFKKRLENNKWLSVETKNKALQKLNSLTFRIGYPKKINTYEGLVVQPNLFFENICNKNAYSFKLEMNTIDKKADMNKWAGALAQTVNAYYAPSDNAVIVPAGILQDPIFNKNDNEANLYGSIGYIIAHELTHGFDNNGRKYNGNGNLENWWTDYDEKSFDNITGYIKRASRNKKNTILAGGTYSKKNGYFIAPTLIETRDPKSLTMCEEIFGPVLTLYVYPANDFDKVLKLVDNTSPYALTGAVLARDRAAIEKATRALRDCAGNFYINDKPTGAVVGQQPFGGARASGTNDKAGSQLNLYRWLSARTIKETYDPPTQYGYPFLLES
jgi:hypothetical protein